MEFTDRILVGDNAFIGVNHLSQERLREKSAALSAKRIGTVINSALSSGADGLVCSAHPNIKAALESLKEEDYSKNFGVHLIVPDAGTYVRQASEKGMIGLLNGVLEGLTWRGKARAVVGGGFSALASNPARLMKTYLEAELSLFSKSLPRNARVKSIFLHELITELVISFKLKDLAKEFIEFASGSLNVYPGFVTRNFARFVEFAELAKLASDQMVILTPFNKVGFQMNPSREACESSLSQLGGGNVIAMSVLAGGYLSLEEAANYLKQLPNRMSCVVGVSTGAHALETFPYLRSSLCSE